MVFLISRKWVDREGLWKMSKMYGVNDKLLDGVKSFYNDSNECAIEW